MLLQADGLQNFTGPPGEVRSVHRIQRTIETNQSFDLTMIEGDILRKKADSAARGGMPERRSQHSSLPAGRTHEAHRQMNCCALSRAVWPQKSENLACFYLYRETIQSMNRATAGETAVFLRDLIESSTAAIPPILNGTPKMARKHSHSHNSTI